MRREEIEAVYDQGRDAVVALVEGLLVRVDALTARVVDLERQVNRSSRNSSMPPSSDRPGSAERASRKGSGRSAGGQPGHPGRHREMVGPESVEAVLSYRPTVCGCGACLEGASVVGEAVCHQVFELPEVAAVVTEHRRVRVACPACAKTAIAELPAGVAGSFGPRLQAAIVALSASRLSREQVAALVCDTYGCPISAASVQAICERASAALAAPHVEIAEAIERSAVVNADETGWKIAGKGAFLWAAASAEAALFRIADTRRQAEAKALLGEGFEGVVGSDRYAGYAFLEADRRQYCWSHLARDFQALAQRPRRAGKLGRELATATGAMFSSWRAERDAGRRPDWSKQPIAAHHDQIMQLLQRGARMRDPKTARFRDSLLDQWPSLWLFTEVEGLEPTNNAAERTLRHAVIWRKLSFGTPPEKGTRFAERLLSVRETCRLQGHSLHEFLADAITAQLHATATPTLLPRASPG